MRRRIFANLIRFRWQRILPSLIQRDLLIAEPSISLNKFRRGQSEHGY